MKCFVHLVTLLILLSYVTPYDVVTYVVKITTDTTDRSETDSDLWVRLYGSLGTTKLVELPDTAFYNDYTKGATDEYEIDVEYIGTLSCLQITIDGDDSFMLSKASAKLKDTDKWWSHENSDNIRLSTDLTEGQASLKLCNSIAEVPYEVKITTSASDDAGTDSDLWVQLFGHLGTTELVELPDTPLYDDYRKGVTDEYEIPLEYVGIISCVRITIVGDDAFMLYKVSVKLKSADKWWSGENSNNVWLSTDLTEGQASLKLCNSIDNPYPWVPVASGKTVPYYMPLEILSTSTHSRSHIEVIFSGGDSHEDLSISWDWSWKVTMGSCGDGYMDDDVPYTSERTWRIEKLDYKIMIFCNGEEMYRKEFSDCANPAGRASWAQETPRMRFGSGSDMVAEYYRRYNLTTEAVVSSSGMSLTTTILIIAGTVLGFGFFVCFAFYTYRFCTQKTVAGAPSFPMDDFTSSAPANMDFRLNSGDDSVPFQKEKGDEPGPSAPPRYETEGIGGDNTSVLPSYDEVLRNQYTYNVVLKQ